MKLTKEKIIDLHGKSSNGMLSPDACAVWLPLVCEQALDLLRAAEERESMLEAIKK